MLSLFRMKYYTPSFFHIKAPKLTLVNDLEQGNADSAAATAASSEFCVFNDGPYWVLGLRTELPRTLLPVFRNNRTLPRIRLF